MHFVGAAPVVVAHTELTHRTFTFIREEVLVRDVLTMVEWNDTWMHEIVFIFMLVPLG